MAFGASVCFAFKIPFTSVSLKRPFLLFWKGLSIGTYSVPSGDDVVGSKDLTDRVFRLRNALVRCLLTLSFGPWKKNTRLIYHHLIHRNLIINTSKRIEVILSNFKNKLTTHHLIKSYIVLLSQMHLLTSHPCHGRQSASFYSALKLQLPSGQSAASDLLYTTILDLNIFMDEDSVSNSLTTSS